uniref:Putative secreted protein n=1 Tax=Anopheles marajoara TaxID=58244 RepID=A0A2M4CEI2_9DIPT
MVKLPRIFVTFFLFSIRAEHGESFRNSSCGLIWQNGGCDGKMDMILIPNCFPFQAERTYVRNGRWISDTA